MLRFATSILPLAAVASLCACAPSPEPRARPVEAAPALPGYDLTRATSSFELPAELTEISALTDIDDHTVACVQDEVGIVYFIDLRTGAVARRDPFGPAGDYEGITRANGSLWVIESSGRMVELVPVAEGHTVRREMTLDLAHDDIEGLGYDPGTKTLLVAPKDQPSGTKSERRARRVFAFDPESGAQATLALETSIDRIEADAGKAGIPLPYKTTKQGREKLSLKVRFSSIAVHPYSDQFFALSAVDAAVLAFGRDGALQGAHCFDPVAMPKLEGMTFLPNGDLVLASEGVEGPARLHVFRYDSAAGREG